MKKVKNQTPKKLIAFDFETTSIKEGTPEVLYLTAFGENDFKLSAPITGKPKNKLKLLRDIIEQRLLIPENNGAQFVGWNSNKFDSYFIAKALLESDRWILHPYMTATKALRGLRVIEKLSVEEKEKLHNKGQKLLQFEFLDGMAMTGVAAPLKKFLKTFAPDYQKLDGPNFDAGEKFNPNNKNHVLYAERDSEGLYFAMHKVSEIVKELTNLDLKPTVGNLAIHHFMDHVPEGVILKRPTDKLLQVLHGDVKRGGYCWAMKQYHGPVWKYDINQAYAAAMRDAHLPSGDCATTSEYIDGQPGIYYCTFSRKKLRKVPFYYKQEKQGLFTIGKKPVSAWLTSIEIEHLKKDEWQVKIDGGYVWESSFNMKHFVDRLEKLRGTDPEGPSGPLGTMVKSIGNNAYGKTLEQVWGQEFVFSKERPDGYDLYDSFNPEAYFIFSRDRKSFPKKYHLPQIGIFVTAHVRCVVREAAIKEEDHFLYADTDCVMFSKPAKHLEVHKTKYGAWKQESDGYTIIVVGKKMYHAPDGSKAKGLIVKKLEKSDYLSWLKGKLPIQIQVQRQNIISFLGGKDMFKNLTRKGTDVNLSKTVKFLEGYFVPA